MLYLRNPRTEDIQKVVSGWLEEARNVSELARTIGRDRATIYAWAKGTSKPCVADLTALAQSLGINLRVDFGPDSGIQEHDDLATLLGRVLSNQQRQLELLERWR